jgi:hypothetical protein
VQCQVNAGAGEVAKVFLSASRIHGELMQAKLKVEATKDIGNEIERRNAFMQASAELEQLQARIMRLKVI